MEQMDTLRGMWRPGFEFERAHHQLPPDPEGRCRLGAMVQGLKNRVFLHQSHPGQHSLFFFVNGEALFFSEDKRALKRMATAMGVRGKIETVDAGEGVVFDGHTVMRALDPMDTPPINRDMSEDALIDLWWETFIAATRETYEAHGGGPVIIASSGGTDSLMVMKALAEIGADVVAMSSGMTMENFDPHWAKVGADEFGVPFTFLPMPSGEEELQALLEDTFRLTGDVGCSSNVLMAMSCLTLRRAAGERRGVYTGYHADILVGNKPGAVGALRKLPEHAQTDEAWRDVKARLATGMIPNTHQLHGSFSGDGFFWRAPFGHPDVIRLALSLPLSISPAYNGRKVFFEKVMNRVLPEGKRPWERERKIAFNTGSGLFARSKEGRVLSDQNLRATLRRIREETGS